LLLENNKDLNTEQKNQNNYMSRKRRAPRRIFHPDSKYDSLVLSKFINFVMYDGKKTAAEKVIYNALDQIKEKTKEDPIKIFNEAIKNVKPNLEVRSRRVGGATYQVPVEVKSNRSQTLALRWIVDFSRKRKNKSMADRLFNELMDASQRKGSSIKKREDTHKMAESNKAFAHFRW
jgi:small subunit ribosomal protein S7